MVELGGGRGGDGRLRVVRSSQKFAALLLVVLLAGLSWRTALVSAQSARRKPGQSIGGLADIYGGDHCTVSIDSSTISDQGLRIGAMLEMQSQYSSVDDYCQGFGGWSSVQQSAALFFAVSHLGSVVMHPGIQLALAFSNNDGDAVIGADVFDSCASSLLGITEAQHFVSETALFRDSALETVADTLLASVPSTGSSNVSATCISTLNTSMSMETPIYGIIGPMSTGAVTAVSPLFSTYNVPHISYWATSTLFDDIPDYPFLFRMVPSDESQASAMADLIEHFGWDFVSLVAAEDDEYSGRGYELLRAEATNRQTFCWDISARFSARASNATLSLARQIRRSQARAVIIYAPGISALPLFRALESENVTGKIFIGSHDWVNRISYRDNEYQSQVPIIGFAPRSLISSVQPAVRALRDALQNASYVAQAVQFDPWLRYFVEGRMKCRVVLQGDDAQAAQCRISHGEPRQPSSNRTFPPCQDRHFRQFRPEPSMVIAESVLASIQVLGNAMANAFFNVDSGRLIIPSSDALPSGRDVLAQLLKLELPCGRNGQCRVFTPEQRAPPAFYIQNVQLDQRSGSQAILPVGEWTTGRGILWYSDTNVDFKTFGTFNLSGSSGSSRNAVRQVDDFPSSGCSRVCRRGEYRVFPNSFLRCCWRCMPCSGNTMTNTTNADVCVQCPLGFESNLTACLPIAPNSLTRTGGEFLSTTILAVIGFLLALLTLIYYRINPNAALVRSSDISLSTVSLAGMLVGYAAVPFIGIGHVPSDADCIVSGVLPEPIKTLVISAVLVKTKRFNSVFNSMKILSRDKRRRFLLGTPMQLLAIALLTLVSVIMSAVYGIFFTPSAVTERSTNSVEVYCDINVAWVGAMAGYNCLLLIICIVFAFLTRKLPEEYNEAQLVYLASLTGFVVWLGLVPAYFVTGRVLRPFIAALSLACLLMAFWICLFCPRIVQMILHKEYRLPRKKSIVTTPGLSHNTSGLSRESPLGTPQPNRRLYNESPLLQPYTSKAETDDTSSECPSQDELARDATPSSESETPLHVNHQQKLSSQHERRYDPNHLSPPVETSFTIRPRDSPVDEHPGEKNQSQTGTSPKGCHSPRPYTVSAV